MDYEFGVWVREWIQYKRKTRKESDNKGVLFMQEVIHDEESREIVRKMQDGKGCAWI